MTVQKKMGKMTGKLDKILSGGEVYKSTANSHKKSFIQISKKPIAIYGLGECSHWFHEIAVKRMKISPIVALDQNPREDDWWGIKRLTTNEFLHSNDFSHFETEIIVCVGPRQTFDSIKKSLQAVGLKKIHFLHDFYEFHSFYVWLPNKVTDRMKRNGGYFKAAYELLADTLSREIFCRLTQTHISFIPLDIPCSPREQQYFPRDINLSRGHQTYVCCGAYNGENISLLRKMLGRTQTIICFEPEIIIYSELVRCAEENLGEVANEIICYNCAVHDRNGKFPFKAGDGLGSRLDVDGNIDVKCVTLDNALRDFSPTFISMDFEGAEVPALKGAEKIIKKHLPDLGICVYHYPEQIAEVIDTINQIQPGYEFFVRNYTGYLTETVVYATYGQNKNLTIKRKLN